MRSQMICLLAGSAFALAPVVASAQPSSRATDAPETIPRELVLALLNLGPGMAGSGAELLVGRAPDDVPPELIPPGLAILGSTTQFENVVIVLTAPQQPDSAVARYEAHLLSAGWTKPPRPQMRQMRGFVPANAPQAGYEQPDLVCRGDSFVMYAGSYRRSGGSLVKVTYNRGSRYSMCKNRQDVTTYRSPYDESPMPILRAPAGAMLNENGGMSASDNMFSTSAKLSTRLTVPQVVAHYDKQMREQGWAVLGEGDLAFIAARSYRKSDEQGRPWTSMLFSIQLPDSLAQSVTLQMIRSQPPVPK